MENIFIQLLDKFGIAVTILAAMGFFYLKIWPFVISQLESAQRDRKEEIARMLQDRKEESEKFFNALDTLSDATRQNVKITKDGFHSIECVLNELKDELRYMRTGEFDVSELRERYKRDRETK